LSNSSGPEMARHSTQPVRRHLLFVSNFRYAAAIIGAAN
jgi:hypothetical protein